MNLPDYNSRQEVRWCAGCGNYSVLAQLKKVLAELDTPQENHVFISGIGCSSRLPYYINAYGMHTIHGRAPGFATGLKAVRPDLTVWIVTGDGDGLSIGGNHLLHVLRRNVDVNILLFNNQIYGLTKGQYSPTSVVGKVTRSSPDGVIDRPVNAMTFALGCGATFAARMIDTRPDHMAKVLRRAALHRGSSFVEIYQNCPVFNDGAFQYSNADQTSDDAVIELEHGQPLTFGGEDRKAIRLHGFEPQVVLPAHDNQWQDLPLHDEHAPTATWAQLLAEMKYPDFPEPIGIFRDVDAPCYDGTMEEQIAAVREQHTSNQLQELFNSGNTWEV